MVALKMVLSGRFASGREVDRFRLEAEAAAGLDHPNIVSVYEVSECDGQPCFAMKLIEGGSLATRAGELSGRYREIASLVAIVARAIHHAHQQGILHRDLKPSNILLDKAGVPHVTDFGLARRLGLAPGVSASTGVVGTHSCTWACRNRPGGERAQSTATDVYGLGGASWVLPAHRVRPVPGRFAAGEPASGPGVESDFPAKDPVGRTSGS